MDSTANLTEECAREPIHIPGAIQPYGVLIAYDLHNEEKIIYASENVSMLAGEPANNVIGQRRGDIPSFQDGRVLPCSGGSVISHSDGIGWSAKTFKTNNHIEVCEFVPVNYDEVQRLSHKSRYKIFEAISSTENEQELLQTLCDELLALSGYDRALAYKFDEEYNGSVVAETLTPSLSGSYFNHHFPASDIPSQARDLLLKKRVRCIPNTRYAPVFIHSDKTATDELDLTDSDLRSVSPVHLAYCQNMGLESTLTVVLILRGALWGLIGLQGSSPKQISHAMFDFCQDVSLIASNKLEGITLLEERNTYSTVLSREREFEALRKVVGGKMRKAADMDTILSYICHELDCDAVVARVGHTRYSFGIDEQGADQILDSVRFKDREIWCTDNLTFTIPPNSSDHLSAFRGGINFCDDLTNSAIVGLRREHVYQRIWAGSRDEKVSRHPTTNMLTPRASFSAWEETVRGRSLPWSQVQKTMMPTMKALVRRVHQEIENLDLSLLARSTTNGVVFTDRKGFLTWANEAFVKISGYPLSKLMGRKPGNLLQGEKSSPETVKHMADCIKAHSSFEVDVINYHQDGSEYWVHISCQPIDKEDPQSGFIAIETDITERIRAREEMTRLVDRLQAAADATNIGIWEYDLVSGTLIWDEWMHRIFGTDPGTFSNTYDDWANTLHPDDKERADGQVKKAIEECTGFDSKFRIHRNGNEVRHIAGKAKFVFSKDGAPIAMIGTNADITEEVLRTEQLEAAKKAADAANAAKSDFMASMSHELRTPLNAIVGFSQILKSEMFGPLANEKYREYAGLIEESGAKLAGLIYTILDISKIESGKREFTDDEIILSVEFVKLSHQFYEKPFCLNPTQISFSSEQRDITLRYDRCAFHQIVENLVTNAVKFSGDNIDVRVSWSLNDNDCGILEVTDKGIGIAQEDLGRILSPFVKGVGNAKVANNPFIANEVEGVGLGLHIVSKILNQTGCSMSVDSELGVGSKFTVTFPSEIII